MIEVRICRFCNKLSRAELLIDQVLFSGVLAYICKDCLSKLDDDKPKLLEE